MRASYYDVIILGSDLSPLLCGALLAKRGFRVLLLGQQTPSADYAVGRLRLPRRPFAYTVQRSPVSHRVMTELGLLQSIRRRASKSDPALQFSLPNHRVDLRRDGAAFEREIEREFPKAKRPIVEFHRLAQEQAKATDRLLELDLAWPPESFLERRELQRATSQIPFDREGRGHDLLAELPEGHPFRRGIHCLSSFSGSGDPSAINPLQRSRLYSGWLNGASLEGGLAALHEQLIERIRSHSGEVRLEERAQEITVRRSAATGVRLFGSEETIGGTFIVGGIDLSALLRLFPDRDPFEQLLERIGEPRPLHYRYALNLVLGRDGVPEGMGRDVYHVGPTGISTSSEPLLHVQLSRLNDELSLAAVEALLPARAVESQGGHLGRVRERVRARVAELFPFLEEHLLLVDSPHDGLPPESRGNKLDTRLRPIERRGPRTMPIVHAFPVTAGLGICAMPVRTPLRGLFLSNSQVAPWLGLEGQMLAARSAARVIAKSDRTKAWMRRRLWTKVEI